MADIDLFRDAYRTKLGRDASDDELQGWVSGSYGGGSVQDRLNQIANSGEAQAYRPPTLGPSEGENRAYVPPDSGQQAQPTAQQPAGADQVAQWYQQYLGRGADQNDISQWLSGAYGWGSAGNMSGIQQGIMGSAEAKARPQTGTGATAAGPYQNTDWWGAQGVPTTQMFDANGQLLPGWKHTANGYERVGSATTGGAGDIQAWLTSRLTGASSPQALAALEPELTKRGIKLQKDSDGNIRGRLYLPDGSTVDVVNNAGWGQPWTWIDRGKGGGTSGGSGGVYTGPRQPGSQYSDPHTKFLEQLLQQMIQARMTPVNDPNRQMYEQMLKQRADALGQGNQQLDQLMGYLQERFTDLQGNGYTGAEGEAIRTGALDPIENDRQAARKRMMERLSARGLTPDSGIAQQALLEVDKAFDAVRGTTQNTLTINDLNRREDRKVRAQTIGAQLADIPDARAREQLDVFGALNQLSQLARSEDEARQREAVGYGGALSDLGPQRLQLAMQAAGMGGNPSSMFGNLMQLAGLNQNAAAYGMLNSNARWSALGSFAEVLARAGR